MNGTKNCCTNFYGFLNVFDDDVCIRMAKKRGNQRSEGSIVCFSR